MKLKNKINQENKKNKIKKQQSKERGSNMVDEKNYRMKLKINSNFTNYFK
jgi:hypothetical protein